MAARHMTEQTGRDAGKSNRPGRSQSGFVLGIETSCDETAVGLYGGTEPSLVGHLVSSQTALHARYGGVVPELAARDHQHHLLPLVDELLHQTGTDSSDILAVACTAGPGLVGALKTGLGLAAGLALGWGIPLLQIHHMEAHLLSVLLEQPQQFPWLALLISGGHTQLVEVRGLGDYRLLGQSRDDAVGEAFDKVAKLLDLPYPGGPSIEERAKAGDPGRFDLPRPMTGPESGLDFSFSGLKTAVLYRLQAESPGWQPGQPLDGQLVADFAASFQQAIAETLAYKVRAALQATQLQCIVTAGGVAANGQIRQILTETAQQQKAKALFPQPWLCTDNGAMIALTGWLRLAAGQTGDLHLSPRSRWPLEQLAPPGSSPTKNAMASQA